MVEQADEFFNSWRLARTERDVKISSLVVLLWDFLLTFEEERQLFWKKPCTIVSCLFYLSRYLAISISLFGIIVAAVPELSDQICFIWLSTEGFLGMVSCWSIQIIIQLRIYALYDRNIKIKYFLLVTFIVQALLLVSIFTYGLTRAQFVVAEAGNMSICEVFDAPACIWSFWMALLSYECLLSFLVIFKACKRVRSEGFFGSWASLHDILIRDSVLYYVGICLVFAANLVIWIKSSPITFDLATGLAVVYPSLIGSHMMINIRRVYYKSLMRTVTSPSEISLPSYSPG